MDNVDRKITATFTITASPETFIRMFETLSSESVACREGQEVVKVHRIKELRKAKGMTQRELADTAGLAMDTISRYERGDREPRITEMSMIAKALGCPTKDILVDEADCPQDRKSVV